MNTNITWFMEIRNEYTDHLVDVLRPFIYEGLLSIYKESTNIAIESKKPGKTLVIFQKYLQSIPTWNKIRIDEETNRIKQLSGTQDYMDDLVKAVIKTHIIMLCYSNTISNVIAQNFYDSFTTSTLIHRCYIECGKDSHNNPYLFSHEFDPIDYKRNQILINSHIEHGIKRAIRKILPISLILKEYLINTLNLIQEPPKVELIGADGRTNVPGNTGFGFDALNLPPYGQKFINGIDVQQYNKTGQTNLSGLSNLNGLSNLDGQIGGDNLDRQVMKMIKTESSKSDKQKIQEMVNLEKIISSIDNKSVSKMSEKAELSTITKKPFHSYIDVLAPNLLEEDDLLRNRDNNIHQLVGTDREIVNIDIDEESTVSDEPSASSTSLSGHHRNRSRAQQTPPVQLAQSQPSRKPSKITKPRRSQSARRKEPISSVRPEASERVDPSRVGVIEEYGSRGSR